MVRSPSKPPPNEKPASPCAPFHSHPSDLELVKSYLRPWVDSGLKAGGGAFIHEVDVYSAAPASLTREFAPAVAQDGECAWYFLSPLRAKSKRGRRKARTVGTGEGCWHSEAKFKPVVDGLDDRRRVGFRQSFSFMIKDGAQRTRTGWLMLELRLAAEGDDEEASAGNIVLCKVYRSPRHPGEDLPPAARKRTADDDKSNASPRSVGKADEDEGSNVTAGRRKSDGQGYSAANVAVPRNTDDEVRETNAAALAPGRKENEAEDDNESAEIAANTPGSKRKAADGESSIATSPAQPARSKRKTDRELHCPQCGYHLDAEAVLAAAKTISETRSETGIVQIKGDSLVKDHTFHQFF